MEAAALPNTNPYTESLFGNIGMYLAFKQGQLNVIKFIESQIDIALNMMKNPEVKTC